MHGTDDLCGAARRAAVVGHGFPNPDGTLGFGLTTVTTSGAAPVHVDARIALPSVNGSWGDSAGNAGGFVFTLGPGAGSPRPVPAAGLAPGSIGATQLAPGAIGAAQLGTGAISYLDGRYVQQAQPIVVAESAGAWRTSSTASVTVFEVLGGVMAAGGQTGGSTATVAYSLPLTGPAFLGATQYRLSEVEYCIRALAAGQVKVDSAGVYSDGFTGGTPIKAEIVDSTDRTSAGVCPRLVVPLSAERSFALVLGIAHVGGATSGSVIISGVRSTWVPLP